MTHNNENITISHGMDVLGSDAEKVGDVADMRGDYVVVSKGFFFPTDYFIPTSAIDSVIEGKVYLGVTKEQALNQGWDVEPEMGETINHDMPITDPGLQIQNPVPHAAMDPYNSNPSMGSTGDDLLLTDEAARRDDAETISVPLVEEELTATTRGVERGEVQVEKTVTTEDRTIEVPVTEEQVHVTRRLVDRDVPAGEQAFDEIDIKVPVYGEEVDVQKRTHVVEEIEIAKQSSTETQRVTDTVRREDVRITDNTGEVIDEDTTPR